MTKKAKILIGILVILIVIIGGRWFLNEFFPPTFWDTTVIDDRYLLDGKYCKQDTDCIMSYESECVNKYNTSVIRREEPLCKCVNNKCVKKDETANWKTYRNEEHEFEIKYPVDFIEQKTESDNILLSITKEDRGSLYITMRVRKNYDINDILSSIGEVKEINVGDHLGYEYFYIEGAGTSRVRLIQLGQDALIIEFDCIGDGQIFATANDKKVYLQTFSNQILSTFRFIEEENKITISEQITTQINKNPDFVDWFKNWQTSNPSLTIHEFLKIDISFMEKMYPWSDFIIQEESSVKTSCPPEFTISEAREIYSPDKTKSIYFPCNIGSPDTIVWLYNRNGDKKMEMIEESGPSGGFDGAFWIDNNHFVILSYFRDTIEECSAYIKYWDLANEKRLAYAAKGLNCRD